MKVPRIFSNVQATVYILFYIKIVMRISKEYNKALELFSLQKLNIRFFFCQNGNILKGDFKQF